MKNFFNVRLQVLLIEEQSSGDLIRMVLEEAGAEVFHAISEEETRNFMINIKPDVIIAGWDEEGLNGRRLIEHLKKENVYLDEVPVVLLANHRVGSRARLTDVGVTWVLDKPIAPLTLPKILKLSTDAMSNRSRFFTTYQLKCGETASGAFFNAVV